MVEVGVFRLFWFVAVGIGRVRFTAAVRGRALVVALPPGLPAEGRSIPGTVIFQDVAKASCTSDTSNVFDSRCCANRSDCFTTLSTKSSTKQSTCSCAASSNVKVGSISFKISCIRAPKTGADCGKAADICINRDSTIIGSFDGFSLLLLVLF